MALLGGAGTPPAAPWAEPPGWPGRCPGACPAVRTGKRGGEGKGWHVKGSCDRNVVRLVSEVSGRRLMAAQAPSWLQRQRGLSPSEMRVINVQQQRAGQLFPHHPWRPAGMNLHVRMAAAVVHDFRCPLMPPPQYPPASQAAPRPRPLWPGLIGNPRPPISAWWRHTVLHCSRPSQIWAH